MKHYPFVFRLLCLGAMRAGGYLTTEWPFAARFGLQLGLVALLFALLAIGSGRAYMKTVPGMIEAAGAALILLGHAGLLSLVLWGGDEFVGPLGAIPAMFYISGLALGIAGLVYGVVAAAKKKEPIQSPQTTTGSSAPDRV
jgi:hypothetical protein